MAFDVYVSTEVDDLNKPKKDYAAEAIELLMYKHNSKNFMYWKEFDDSFIKDDDVVALVDADYLTFVSASKEMERYIVVNINGKDKEFSGFTELKKHIKSLGLESEYQEISKTAIKKQRNHKDALNYAKASVKKKIRNIIEETGATVVALFMGSDGNHRDSLPLPMLESDGISCWRYKGQREPEWVPLTLDPLKDWSLFNWRSHWSVGRETDDDITITFHKLRNRGVKVYLCGIDKDFNQEQWGGLFIVGHHEHATWFDETEENKLGWLEIDRTNKVPKVKGHGDMFLAYQVLTEDVADNYSSKKFLSQLGFAGSFGDVTAVKYLSKAKTRKELWQSVYDYFKKNLPETLTYVDCFGIEHKDCKPIYFADLYYKCAKMMEHTEYVADITELFDELGVEYDE